MLKFSQLGVLVLGSMLLVFAASFGGCSCSTRNGDAGTRPDSSVIDTGMCSEGELLCDGNNVQRCMSGVPTFVEECTAPEVCLPGGGCGVCSPGNGRCVGQVIERCNAAGDTWEPEMTCADDEACRENGPVSTCVNACEDAQVNRSNIGCEYWAVDLDNEYGKTMFGTLDAANQPWSIVLANPGTVPAMVRVEQNTAALGEVPVPVEVASGIAEPGGVLRLDLPQREVDGSMARPNDGPGTWVGPNAFRVTSNFPVVAYQFNPIDEAASNDASLLIPTSGLDTNYRVLGWPTANPIKVNFPGFPDIDGIPDHSFVTIVGVMPDTLVTVTLGGNGSTEGGPIPAAAGGETITYTIGPFDVLNIESAEVVIDGIPTPGSIPDGVGDLTGTVVVASNPVAVFSGAERGIAPITREGVPGPGGDEEEDVCCTDHLEEQVFPTSAWGKDFVVTRSPIRSSDSSYTEPDLYRVMADRMPTLITTNLDAPDNSFTLQPGEWREFNSQRSFVLTADNPIALEQMLVSQDWIPDQKPGHGGDPSLIFFPPYQQYRERYIFLTPPTFTADYVVIAMPVTASVELDGSAVVEGVCTIDSVGTVDGIEFQAATCLVEDGAHEVSADVPVGIMVYGYYNVGSYGYAGGSDLEQINLF